MRSCHGMTTPARLSRGNPSRRVTANRTVQPSTSRRRCVATARDATRKETRGDAFYTPYGSHGSWSCCAADCRYCRPQQAAAESTGVRHQSAATNTKVGILLPDTATSPRWVSADPNGMLKQCTAYKLNCTIDNANGSATTQQSQAQALINRASASSWS